jgi:hypothetical protein
MSRDQGVAGFAQRWGREFGYREVKLPESFRCGRGSGVLRTTPTIVGRSELNDVIGIRCARGSRKDHQRPRNHAVPMGDALAVVMQHQLDAITAGAKTDVVRAVK